MLLAERTAFQDWYSKRASVVTKDQCFHRLRLCPIPAPLYRGPAMAPCRGETGRVANPALRPARNASLFPRHIPDDSIWGFHDDLQVEVGPFVVYHALRFSATSVILERVRRRKSTCTTTLRAPSWCAAEEAAGCSRPVPLIRTTRGLHPWSEFSVPVHAAGRLRRKQCKINSLLTWGGAASMRPTRPRKPASLPEGLKKPE